MCRTDQCVGSRPVLRTLSWNLRTWRPAVWNSLTQIRRHGGALCGSKAVLVWPPTRYGRPVGLHTVRPPKALRRGLWNTF
eukprot:1038401-Prymnesium_polylepis.1